MIIDKNSWHYKLVYKFRKYGPGPGHPEDLVRTMPRSLCMYGWYLLGAIATLVFAGMGVAGMPIAIWFKWFAPFSGDVTVFDYYGLGWGVLLTFLGMLGSLVWVLLFIVVICIFSMFVVYAFQELKNMIFKRDDSPPKVVSSEPSVILEWLRAMKNKVCPIIEYRETKK